MATASLENLRARREAVVDAHVEAEAVKHDVAAVLATFHHPRYEVPAMGAAVDGGEAVHGLLTQLLGAFPDFWVEKIHTHHADDAVIVELRFGGTHRGTFNHDFVFTFMDRLTKRNLKYAKAGNPVWF